MYYSVKFLRRAQFQAYGRVCCFKGFDEESFAFNTAASAALLERQFGLMTRYLSTGIDLYAYVTLTSRHRNDLSARVENFMDRLQAVHVNLPLRTVPLEVQTFTTVESRMNAERRKALKIQYEVVEIWKEQLKQRFSSELRSLPITEISLA